MGGVTVTLRNGVPMPKEGYGVLRIDEAEECQACVEEALAAGYRLIDTAASYYNEEAVGLAVKNSGIPRSEVFITTKLWIQDAGYEKAILAFEESLSRLGLDYLDLYLIHQPFGDYYGAWRALEKLYDDGRIRAIGVSNFDEARLVDLCMNSRIPPLVNQIEMHPFYQQDQCLRYMKERQVQPQAWGPFCEGQKAIFQNNRLAALGRKYGKTAAQIILRWNIQRGVAVIPGSSQPEHIRENADIWDFVISDTDMKTIQELDQGYSEIIDHHSGCTAKWLNEWKIHDGINSDEIRQK